VQASLVRFGRGWWMFDVSLSINLSSPSETYTVESGFIDYHAGDELQVHSSLLNIVLHD
jgi:hypothetical protein